jgi:hypothetical protein
MAMRQPSASKIRLGRFEPAGCLCWLDLKVPLDSVMAHHIANVAVGATMAKDPAAYREHAAQCIEKANAAKDVNAKEYWRRMAEDWTKLAESTELTQKRE